MNFFDELKRRNVIRMAGLYLVGAWLLMQMAGTVLPMFGAPDWLPRSIVVLLAIGFLPALIFGWVFELTPQGLKRDEEVAPEESIAPQTARRMNRMIIAVLMLALGYFGFDKFVLAPRREAALVAATEKSVAAQSSTESKSPTNAKSVAVLGFDNLSDDKGNVAFESQDNLRLEIGHVLFIDIVGYSKLLIEEQKERLDQLTKIVLATAQVRDSTDEQLVRLPTGDGMALVFHHSAEEPARCALEIAEALRKHPEIPVRMGIHSGPVSEVTDVSGRTNIAGAGINTAQRVMAELRSPKTVPDLGPAPRRAALRANRGVLCAEIDSLNPGFPDRRSPCRPSYPPIRSLKSGTSSSSTSLVTPSS